MPETNRSAAAKVIAGFTSPRSMAAARSFGVIPDASAARVNLACGSFRKIAESRMPFLTVSFSQIGLRRSQFDFENPSGSRGMMTANGLSTTDFNGKPVRYQGVLFEGSPRVVFWGGFFEPFMYGAARLTLEWVVATRRDRHLDLSQYLSEATSLLAVLTREAYEDMASTDQLLRGRGFPKSVTRTSVSHKIEAMTTRVEDLKAALIHRGEAAPPPEPDTLTLKPGIWGIYVDLKALWRRWLRRSV